MYKFTVTIPSIQKDGTPVYPPARYQAVCDVRDGLTGQFGGCTLVEGEGAWKHSDGRIVVERVTLVSTLVDEDRLQEAGEAFDGIAKYLKDALNQECVLVTRENAQAWFV